MSDLLHWNSFASGLLDESSLVLHINGHFPVGGKYCTCKYSAGIDCNVPRGSKLMQGNLEWGSYASSWREERVGGGAAVLRPGGGR